jgi:2-keto-4-pentenoate hydratase/2-oxohepta-3-ene-1,7-dioic acid hydratase in catechol pathway
MHRVVCTLIAIALTGALAPLPFSAQQKPTTAYVRYTHNGTTSYGILEGDTIRELKGDLFAKPAPTGRRVKRAEVQLLAPCEPRQVIAVGLNYKSHLGDRPPAAYPGLFAKLPNSIVGPEANIVIPADAENIHYEGELVVVMGRRAKNVSKAEAASYIFGVTAGNDVSERAWQKADLQWFRAKASDTFGPMGPAIVTGLNYNDVLLQTRLNGEVVQSERTRDLLFDVETIVSYVSKYVTLEPGDVIFTGTPDVTRPFKAGDVIEVEIEGIGVLRNRAVKGGAPK